MRIVHYEKEQLPEIISHIYYVGQPCIGERVKVISQYTQEHGIYVVSVVNKSRMEYSVQKEGA